MSFLKFLADLTLADWLLLLVAWVVVAFALGTFTGLLVKRADEAEPEPGLDWRCSDGRWRTEADAAAWVAETDGSLAECADFFDGIPADCLSDDAVHSRFDSIVRGEFA